MRAAVLDTNVIIFAFFRDSKHHEEARKILRALDRWVIPFIVLVELFWFTRSSGLDEKTSKALIESLLIDRKSEMVGHPLDEVLDSLNVSDPLEWEDELILLVAERTGLPVVSFDGKLRKRAEARGVRIIP